jgi:hypothetical protein
VRPAALAENPSDPIEPDPAGENEGVDEPVAEVAVALGEDDDGLGREDDRPGQQVEHEPLPGRPGEEAQRAGHEDREDQFHLKRSFRFGQAGDQPSRLSTSTLSGAGPTAVE